MNASEINIETLDGEKVEQAVQKLKHQEFDAAELLLLEVIKRTPISYVNEEVGQNGDLNIKFWDQHSFIQYVTWQTAHGVKTPITWIENVYPRAYYYLGFINNHKQCFNEAIIYLNKGIQLEPTNPHFKLEKAQVLIGMNKSKEAYEIFTEINAVGPYVSANQIATALRGEGYILIEEGNFDVAKEIFNKSLKFDPNNSQALNELRYIEHLQSGGDKTFTINNTTSPSKVTCKICGKSFSNYIVQDHGTIICNKCDKKTNGKWWQLWK